MSVSAYSQDPRPTGLYVDVRDNETGEVIGGYFTDDKPAILWGIPS